MPETFPLLKLAGLAIKEVIIRTPERQLIYLSLLSRRAQLVVKWFRPKHMKPRISLISSDNQNPSHPITDNPFHICVISILEHESMVPDMNLNGKKARIRNVARGIATYWDSRLEGLNAALDHFKVTFNAEIIQAIVGKNYSNNLLIDWMITPRNNWWDLFASRVIGIEKESDLLYFMANCDAQDLFSVFMKTSKSMKLDKPILSTNVRDFFTSGHCLNLGHLLSLNCERIALRDSEFKNSDMNIFLKNWISGGCPDLKELQLEGNSKQFELTKVLRELETTETNMERHFEVTGRSIFYSKETFVKSFDITNVNGKIASIWTTAKDYRQLGISVHPFFQRISF